MADFADGRVRKVTPVSYGVRDGMKTRACNVGNQPVAWKTADGLLLFSSLKGVAVVAPRRLTSSSYVPPVHIEAVTVNRRKQPLDREPSLPAGAGEVQIDYAALSYLDPEKVRYKYMLAGFDTDWVDAGDRSFAYYANLPPGTYRFHVVAGSVDGQWNQRGAYFEFNLQPRFYQTWLFWGAVASSVLLFAWLFHRLRMHELKATVFGGPGRAPPDLAGHSRHVRPEPGRHCAATRFGDDAVGGDPTGSTGPARRSLQPDSL